MNAGFYRFDVHFFDGAEQNAHGFVYAENYANAVEKVCDMLRMKTSRIPRLKVWSPAKSS